MKTVLYLEESWICMSFLQPRTCGFNNNRFFSLSGMSESSHEGARY